jgi:hypothetical protein
MSVKAQGTQFNKTVTDFLAAADFGSFNVAYLSVVLRGDSSRHLYLTGFSWVWTVGVAGDINANAFSNVFLVDNIAISPDSNNAIFPDINSRLQFAFGETMPSFTNSLDRQLLSPFRLQDGVNYSLIATIQTPAPGVGPYTARLTAFGYEEIEGEQAKSFYAKSR